MTSIEVRETVEMRASKYWSQRQDARRERDEALAALDRVKERCALMRFWGGAGRNAASFIEVVIESSTQGLARPSAPDDGLKPTGAGLIAAERRRQVEVEGWTMEHDREHGSRRIELAADCYAGYSNQWPWYPAEFKPKGPLHNLVVAGALYQAALDITDPESYHAGVVAQLRDTTATRIDQMLADVAEMLA